MLKDDLPKSVEEMVRRSRFNRTIQDIKARNADADPGQLQALIDDAVAEIREERGAKAKRTRCKQQPPNSSDLQECE